MHPHMRHHQPRARAGAALLASLALVLGACSQQAVPAATGQTPSTQAPDLEAQTRVRVTDFGPNVRIFDPSMPVAQVQAAVDQIYAQQVDAEFGSGRYTLLFRPGTYGTPEQPLMVKVGYYTEVAGLGASPTDVTINGHVDVYNRCLPTTDGSSNCLALVNFWRSVSNLSINVMGGADGCRASGNFWAVSQAAPMRRVNVTGGNLTLMDYCTAGPQYASGGFISDSKTQFVINGSQQQFLVRNSAIGGWSNGVWNQVFAGVDGAPAQSFPNPPYTTLPTTPVSREKPYLYLDAQNEYVLFVPAVRRGSAGAQWPAGQGEGRRIPMRDVYIATPATSMAVLNYQLSTGKHLILTPGVYSITQTLQVSRPGTVIYGMGVATLNAEGGVVPINVSAAGGVNISGLMLDAGPVNSPALLRLGSGRGGNPADPSSLHDVYFRIGGARAGRATVSLEVNSAGAILDDIWAWRADHGSGFGWTVNPADHGVIVNGDDVTATGLFVEHYQKDQVVWNGERGQTVMFQSEMPYDPPNQAAWQHDGILGYASYKVADTVQTHTGWGLGSYIFTNVDPSIHATHGFEVPVTPGVRMNSLLTVQLSAGTIDHVINDVGAPVNGSAIGVPSNVVSYP